MTRRRVSDARRDPKLHRFGRRWTRANDTELATAWGELHSLQLVARALGRSVASVYWRAHELGLKRGAPEDCEYVTNAAKRCGYALNTFLHIMRWAGVSVRRSLSRPRGKITRGYHYVDRYAADAAIEAWLATEPLHSAATRHTLTAETVERMLAAHGVTRPKKLPPRVHWRVDSALVDELVAAYRKRKQQLLSIGKHAQRVGVYRTTLAKWLQAAGVAPANLTNRGCQLPVDVVDRVVAECRGPRVARAAIRAHANRVGIAAATLGVWLRMAEIDPVTASNERVDRLVERRIAMSTARARRKAA